VKGNGTKVPAVGSCAFVVAEENGSLGLNPVQSLDQNQACSVRVLGNHDVSGRWCVSQIRPGVNENLAARRQGGEHRLALHPEPASAAEKPPKDLPLAAARDQLAV
jgi:hypothetical protein